MSEEIELPERDPLKPCADEPDLHRWIRTHTGLEMPIHPVCKEHQSPFKYICKAYFEPASDLIVGAPRGGGKTRLAALATLLDLIHKPGCAVSVIGGSMQQSLRMWEHLEPDVQRLASKLIIKKGYGGTRRIRLKTKSDATALPQSEHAVRGLRVQKLRCDEVAMFKPEIWEAAQFVTRSIKSPELVQASIEAISTHHKRGGVMEQIIDRAKENGTEIIQWCLLEVLEKCPQERKCETCPLWNDCKGIAKEKCSGFLRIDDAIRMKQRVSLDAWETEMMCHRPSTSMSVFPHFEREVHVRTHIPDRNAHGLLSVGLGNGEDAILAIDFGFHNPFVCLWIVDDGVNVHVMDEYVQSGQTMDAHVKEIQAHGNAKRICCDPAGAGRNDQTAESNIQLLRRNGFRVYHKSSRIIDGLEMIRAALRPAAGNPTLFIHPRCKTLIKAMERLKFPDKGGELPFKDGEHDHPVDALRYFYVNRGNMRPTESRRY